MLVGLGKDRPSAGEEQHYREGNQGERPGSSRYDNRALVSRLHVGSSSTADVTFRRSRRYDDTTRYAPSVIIFGALRSVCDDACHTDTDPASSNLTNRHEFSSAFPQTTLT